MASIRAACRDPYEAQKLAGLARPRRAGAPALSGVVDAFGSELVVSLSDGSAHSVELRDGEAAEALADFLQSVFDGADRVTAAEADGARAEISKAPR